jgi:hypothetical protein
VLSFCFRYDAHDSRYVLAAWNLMRAGGGLTMLLLFGGLGLLWRRELKKGRTSRTTPPSLPGCPGGTLSNGTGTKTSTASARG